MPLNGLIGSWPNSDTIITAQAINRTGSTLSAGDVVAFDLTGSDGDVSDYATDPGAPFSNVIAVAAGHVTGWIFAVAAESIDNDERGKFCVKGVCDVKVAGSSAVSNGDKLSVEAAADNLVVRADAEATVGIALEDGPSGAADTVKVLLVGADASLGAAGAVG